MEGVHLNWLIQREHERCTPQLVDPERTFEVYTLIG